MKALFSLLFAASILLIASCQDDDTPQPQAAPPSTPNNPNPQSGDTNTYQVRLKFETWDCPLYKYKYGNAPLGNYRIYIKGVLQDMDGVAYSGNDIWVDNALGYPAKIGDTITVVLDSMKYVSGTIDHDAVMHTIQVNRYGYHDTIYDINDLNHGPNDRFLGQYNFRDYSLTGPRTFKFTVK